MQVDLEIKRGTLANVKVSNTKVGKVANFSIAINKGRYNKVTNKWENLPAEWVRCTAWKREAELVSMMKKGDVVFVLGYGKTNKWEDKDGKKREDHQINVQHLHKVDTDIEKALRDKNASNYRDDDREAESESDSEGHF